MLELWVARSVTLSTSCCLAGQLQLCPPCSSIRHLPGSTRCCLAVSPLLPVCPSPPLLPVWMNVSSLSPWLSDFHTVQFSVSSGCFFAFKLLLSLFCLCKEAQCVYLHLHLGQKSSGILKEVPWRGGVALGNEFHSWAPHSYAEGRHLVKEVNTYPSTCV